MAVASLRLPAKNPAFNLPDYAFVRLAGRTLAKAHLEHPEEADGCIKGVVPLRKSFVYLFPQAVLKRDALGISPAEERCAELSPVAPVALAAERLLGEPAVALGWICLGNNDAPQHKQRGQGAVKRPQDKSSVPG